MQNQNFDAKKLSTWGCSTLLHPHGYRRKEYLETHFYRYLRNCAHIWRETRTKRTLLHRGCSNKGMCDPDKHFAQRERKMERLKVSTQTNLFDENVFLFFSLLVSTRHRTKCSFMFSLFSSQS